MSTNGSLNEFVSDLTFVDLHRTYENYYETAEYCEILNMFIYEQISSRNL